MKVYKTNHGILRVYRECYEVEMKSPYYCFVEIPKDENQIPSKEICKGCVHNRPKMSFYLHCGGKVIEEMHEIVKTFNTKVPQLSEYYTYPINELIELAMDWNTCLMDFFELCGGEAAYDLTHAMLSSKNRKRI
jgi:hypothetical protein